MHCWKTFINNRTKCLFISRYIDVMSNSSALKDLLFERKYWFTATKLMLVNLLFLNWLRILTQGKSRKRYMHMFTDLSMNKLNYTYNLTDFEEYMYIYKCIYCHGSSEMTLWRMFCVTICLGLNLQPFTRNGHVFVSKGMINNHYGQPTNQQTNRTTKHAKYIKLMQKSSKLIEKNYMW